jgi:hypothetical protein
MDLSYCYGKLSEAVNEMCVSNQSLKDRLRSCVRHGLIFLPMETLPEGLHEQFSEIRSALPVVRMPCHIEPYPDSIDTLKPAEVRGLIHKLISLHNGVAAEYYRRSSHRTDGASKNESTDEDLVQRITQLMGHVGTHSTEEAPKQETSGIR